jgi:hypothetical protein
MKHSIYPLLLFFACGCATTRNYVNSYDQVLEVVKTIKSPDYWLFDSNETTTNGKRTFSSINPVTEPNSNSGFTELGNFFVTVIENDTQNTTVKVDHPRGNEYTLEYFNLIEKSIAP